MANGTSDKSLPAGVRLRDGAIEINFSHNKERYFITLPHSPTAEGISAAAKIRSELKTKAKWGILSDADIANARGFEIEDNSVIVKNGVLFQEVAQKYLRQWDGDINTKKGYVSALNYHWMPHLALMPIQDITHDDIRELIILKEFKSAKTLNNCLVSLRGVFDTAMNNKLISENPMNGIENKKIQVSIPDPFSRAEMNALLDWLDKNSQGEERFYYWFYQLAFWTGCRPSELFALRDSQRQSDIDWFNETLRISKARVRGVEKNTTKTHNARDVYLNDRSKLALQELINFKKEHAIVSEYLLVCPETREPIYAEDTPRARLVKAMKALGIRHRPAYNCRHTYATMLLMDGINPVFVADQLGHSLEMLMKRYAKWMHGDKNRIEMSKLNTK